MEKEFSQLYIRSCNQELLKELHDSTIPDILIVWCDAFGDLIYQSDPLESSGRIQHKQWVDESFRWGESYISMQDDERFSITLALSQNQQIVGGIILENLRLAALETLTEDYLGILREWGDKLLEWAIYRNLVNEYLMLTHRNDAKLEREQAEMIHSAKKRQLQDLHSNFERFESDLVLAMRRGDRKESVKLLNQIMISLFQDSEERFAEIRELMLELVLIIRRTVIECNVNRLKIPNAQQIWSEAFQLQNHEELTEWVRQYLNGLIEEVSNSSIPADQLRVKLALNYIRSQSRNVLTRGMVASRIGLSESECSRLIKRNTGKPFQQHLIDCRIADAIQMLRSSHLNVGQIAIEAGFESASHFTYTFRKHTGRTPSSFRYKSAQNLKQSSHSHKQY